MKSLQELLETEGSINTTAAVATPDAPMFLTRRFGGWDDHVVPEDHYNTIKNGRDRMARWDTHLPNVDIKGAVQKSLYRDGCCLITNAKTNLSVMLKHDRLKRQRMQNTDDSVTMAYESTELDPNGDFTLFGEAEVAELIAQPSEDYEFTEDNDEEYLQAYGYYSDEQGKTDDESDVFGQIVACFFDNLYSSQDETDTIDSMYNAAVTEVKSGSESMGLNDVTIDIIQDAKKYIEENYDVVTGERVDDGNDDDEDDEFAFDVDDDDDEDDDMELTEAATLAELPTVSAEDSSKDENEGWAIVNMKDQKVIDKPKQGESMELKNSWLKEYYGASGSQSGHEVAWVNIKTGIVSKVKT